MGYVLEVGREGQGSWSWMKIGRGGQRIRVWDRNGVGGRYIGECRKGGKEWMGRMMTLFHSRIGATASYIVIAMVEHGAHYDLLNLYSSEVSVTHDSPMFPLSCACMCAHPGRETSAHKKTWSAHTILPLKMVFHIYHTRHSKFR